jgi:hypothetical protein
MKMATEDHGHGHREDRKQKKNSEMDLELAEVRERIEKLVLRMQQDAKTHWEYEWPMKRKVKWPVKKLLVRRQQRLLRRWLRFVKSLRATEEMVHTCELEAGRNLSDDEVERSRRDIIEYQVRRDELSNCQVGNIKRSSEGLIYCQEGGAESSNF